MALGLRIRESPSDAVVSAATSGASSAACAAACSSAALCLFSLGASAHSWCCKARRSPASRFALLVGGRAYANSSSASPAAARLAAGTVCSASTGHASRNAALAQPPEWSATTVRLVRRSGRRRQRRAPADEHERTRHGVRPALRHRHAPVGVGRGPA